ncbi:MAG: copper amine oxidase N-terminal domain-containing protein [Candidatus Eremiobacter antarcticus]
MRTWLIPSKTHATALCPRAVVVALAALVFCGWGTAANATPQTSYVIALADFGSPPSGKIPIIFNDHTVYTKPDILKQQRVLAALVKGSRIYVPLRSMLEEMGATVSTTDGGKTVTASKSGASVSVTLGKNEVVINGEKRPLDVPPVMYRGIVLVPVRVISEALGAYVEWLPARHIVVIRYIPAVEAPHPVPTPMATPAPPISSPTPTAPPEEKTYQGFIQAAGASSRTYNEFASGQRCCRSYLASTAYAFKNSPFAIKGDYRRDEYVTAENVIDSFGNHYTNFNTIDGGSAFTPVFLARQTTWDARLEYQVAAPRIYIGAGYLQAITNYGYPRLNAFGGGVEKLPDLRSGLDFFGSAFYYPSASGDYTVTDAASPNNGVSFKQQYRILTYDVGLSLTFGISPLYLYGGFSGDRYTAKQNAPIDQTHAGPYIGLGVRF